MTEKQKTFDNLIADVNEILTNDAKKICELINSYILRYCTTLHKFY